MKPYLMISNIPKRSLRNLAIYTGVLVLVIGVLIIPSYFAIGKAEANLAKVESEVKEQRQLAPIFGKLMKASRELNKSTNRLPARKAISRDEAGNVADMFIDLAADSRLQMEKIEPDLNALVNEARLMRIDMVLRGSLDDYRTYLNQLIELPHVEFIERLRILAIPDGREYRMRIWLALK